MKTLLTLSLFLLCSTAGLCQEDEVAFADVENVPVYPGCKGDNTELKALSYWPAEDYLNIWVAELKSGWLGWAEYPTSTIIHFLPILCKRRKYCKIPWGKGARFYPEGLFYTLSREKIF